MASCRRRWPVLATLVSNPDVAWRGPANPVPQHRPALGYHRDAALRDGALSAYAAVGRGGRPGEKKQANFQRQASAALAALPGKLEIEDTSTLTHDEMLQRVSTLPPDTLVLFGIYYKDSAGRDFIPAEVAAEVGQAGPTCRSWLCTMPTCAKA